MFFCSFIIMIQLIIDAEIQELHGEIRKLQKSLNTKHNKFNIQLCLFEPIISNEIEVKDNSVRYTGKANKI